METVTEQDAGSAAVGMRAAVEARGPEGSKGRMDQVITAVVDGVIVPVTGVIPVLLSSGILFLVFAALWLAFGAGLILNQGGLDNAWEWIRSLPLIVQGVAWLLVLPVVGALWAWETSWPLVLRLVIVAGLCGWSLMICLPRSPQA